jgi:hypothetical protein
MGRKINECAWSTRIGNATVTPSELAECAADRWTAIRPQDRTKLTNAVQAAPRMVAAAVTALVKHNATKHQSPTGTDEDDPDFTPVGLGLMKYFSLEVAKPRYWDQVLGVLKVFRKIQVGLGAAYKIELGSHDSWRGWVKGKDRGRAAVSPIRATFGFADEWGHVPYDGPARQGRINVALEYLIDDRTTYDQLARTIVHEASHRWAFTKDVLYKHASFGAIGSTDDPLEQDKVRVPGRAKILMPMKGYDLQAGGTIADERWLENADSYAWFARRMWKRAGRIMA